MPRERLSMRKIREVLRLRFEQRLSLAKIAEACQVGIATVHEYLKRAQEGGLSWPLPPDWSDEQIEARLFPQALPLCTAPRAQPDLARIAQQLRRKGVTLFLLWEEYRVLHPDGYGYSRFCDLYRDYAARLDPRLRQTHKAGEKLFVDYAGQTIAITERATGTPRTAQVFVATLGASDYTYAEATWTQGLEDWISSHMRAFAFFGGVPELVVPDNLKSGVTSPCYYDPQINPTYQEMAEHYGVAILPARVRKPRDKAKVENHVLHVERRILAPLRDRSFLSLEECNHAIAELLEILNRRSFQHLSTSRRQLFEELEFPAMQALPLEAYSFGQWKKARVNIDYHIAVEHCFYSVPYTLIRQEVEVRLSQNVVEVFYKGGRVASHPRCTMTEAGNRLQRHVTCSEHMPKAHQAYLEWTPQRLAQWTGRAGPATAALVEQILRSRAHPQQGFRSCLGLIRLAKEYGDERLEAACAKALLIDSPRYKSVRSILQHKLDQAPDQSPNPARTGGSLSADAAHHANIRGATYYQPAAHQPAAEDRNDSTDQRETGDH